MKATLGPSGRNVILDKKFGSPTITKDGVTVAKEIELEDPYENMGAQLVREVASKTSDVAGDGTTTATILAESIYREGLRNVTAGANPTSLQRGIMKAVEAIVEELKKIMAEGQSQTQAKLLETMSAMQEQMWQWRSLFGVRFVSVTSTASSAPASSARRSPSDAARGDTLALAAGERDHEAFGAAADGAAKVKMGCKRGTTRQDEAAERFEFRVHHVDFAFQPQDLRFLHPQGRVGQIGRAHV